MTVSVHHSGCIEWLAAYDGPLFDSVVTDPPYHLTSIVKRFGGANAAEAIDRDGVYKRASRGFMGKTWDGGDIAQRPETWRAVYDVLKPGAHLVAFAGTRTYHRMVVAIEDAGFEVRDMLCWHYGSGFPKNHRVNQNPMFCQCGEVGHNGVSKAPAHTSAARIGMADVFQNCDLPPEGAPHSSYTAQGFLRCQICGKPNANGYGTALKPAFEPIVLARKPLSEKNIAANVLKHGTGALNIDGCRVDSEKATGWAGAGAGAGGVTWNDGNMGLGKDGEARPVEGRWPANVIHDGSDEVVAMFPTSTTGVCPADAVGGYGGGLKRRDMRRAENGGDSGSAARFFYSAKAGPLDRIGTSHATVKPVDLMRWLVRLVTPPGGRVLDPFAGSGTTGIACMAEGFDCQMIELEAEHVADIERKLAFLRGQGGLSVMEKHKAKRDREAKDGALDDAGPLFGVA